MQMRGLLACGMLGYALAIAADFEVQGPDGRRALLKGDGTWRYVTQKDTAKSGEAPRKAEKRKVVGDAVLSLERRERVSDRECLFGLRFTNDFPHIVQSFVPTFSARRANDDVAYDSLTAAFQAVKPGDSQNREIIFRGISCQNIARLQVSGGDRCVMGDLARFDSEEGRPRAAPLAEGACLARVRVVASPLVRFEK